MSLSDKFIDTQFINLKYQIIPAKEVYDKMLNILVAHINPGGAH